MRETIAAVLTAVIGLAVIAVILSQKSNTTGVLQSGGSAIATLIQAATGPVTGNYGSANTTGASAVPMIGNLQGASTGNYTAA